jgi:hypothetical protein
MNGMSQPSLISYDTSKGGTHRSVATGQLRMVVAAQKRILMVYLFQHLTQEAKLKRKE